MSRTHRLLAALLALTAGPAARADDPPGDLQPVAPSSQKRLYEFRNYGQGGAAVLSPDGKTLVSGSGGNQLLLFDLTAPSSPNQYRQPRFVPLGNVNFYNAALAFLPDGKTVVGVAAHGEDASVRFWDLASGKELRQIDNDQQQFVGLAVSADGKMLALGTHQRVELWDAADGDEIRILRGSEPNAYYRALAFAPDGRTLATAGMGPDVQLWELATGKERHTFRLAASPQAADPRFRPGGEGLVGALAFSRDGRLLAAGAADATVRVWDLTTGRELLPLTGNSGAVRALVFTPDGKQLVAFDTDGLRVAWNVGRLKAPPEKLAALDDAAFDELWDDLTEADSFRTYRAVRHLAADPRRAAPLLAKHLTPVPPGDAERITRLVADLQNPNAGVRRKAMTELRGHGEAALGALMQLPDQQRHQQAVRVMLNKLEAQFNTPERARTLRAVQVLEQLGGEEARLLLDKLAGGAAGARLTSDAKAALGRLAARGEKAAAAPPDPAALWADLADEDARTAYRAVVGLAALPGQSEAVLGKHLRPVPAVDAKRLDELAAGLASDDFATRQRSAEELEKLGEAAEPLLKKVLEAKPALDTRRRVEELQAKLRGQGPSGDQVRELRAVEVLERLATPEARQLLEALAKGMSKARLTEVARDSVQRLARRPAGAL